MFSIDNTAHCGSPIIYDNNSNDPNNPTGQPSQAIQKIDDRTRSKMLRIFNSDSCIKLKTLLDSGLHVNARDYWGDTPLSLAIQYTATNCIELLLDSKAEVNAKSTSGDTPLHYAAPLHTTEGLQLLLEKGANVNAQNDDGDTPLHLAAYYRCISNLSLLLDNGAEVNAINARKNRPLNNVVKGALLSMDRENVSFARIAKTLLEHGADLKAKDADGLTPIECAEYENLKNILKTLKTWEKQQELWDLWVMEKYDFKSHIQWLPREMLEDTTSFL